MNGTLINTDITWIDSVIDPPTNGLFTPALGTGSDFRMGRTVWVKKIYISWYLEVPAYEINVFPQAIVVRLALVQDTQTNGTQMTGLDVFQDGLTSSNAQLLMTTHQNVANFGRFKVLRDETITLPINTTYKDETPQPPNYFTGAVSKTGDWIWKPKVPVKVNYNELPGGSISDVIDNSWHVVAHSTNSNFPVRLYYSCRTTYCG